MAHLSDQPKCELYIYYKTGQKQQIIIAGRDKHE
jgi:hypothetical protein